MRRRRFLSAVSLGAVSLAGCVSVDTQPSEVPIWVQNRTSDERTVDVECLDTRADDVLVASEIDLDSGTEESVYAEPIEADGEYDVTVTLESTTAVESFSGGGVRDIEVEIRSATAIRFEVVGT